MGGGPRFGELKITDEGVGEKGTCCCRFGVNGGLGFLAKGCRGEKGRGFCDGEKGLGCRAGEKDGDEFGVKGGKLDGDGPGVKF